MRIVVTGAGGQLGAALVRALDAHEVVALDRRSLDVSDPGAVEATLRSATPDAIVHTAAWTDVDGCEENPDRARRMNAEGAANVARAAGKADLVVISTDYVFDGTLGRPYVETDEPNPIQVYGETKLAGERAAQRETDRVAIVRTAWLYGARRPDGAPASNFVSNVLAIAARGPIEVVDDQVGSPTSVDDLASALAALLERFRPGVFHVVNDGAVSRYEVARAALEGAGRDPDLIRPVKSADSVRPARRPAFAPLEGKAWRAAGFAPLPDWRDALARALPAIAALNPA